VAGWSNRFLGPPEAGSAATCRLWHEVTLVNDGRREPA
jgi:hypothetical protein